MLISDLSWQWLIFKTVWRSGVDDGAGGDDPVPPGWGGGCGVNVVSRGRALWKIFKCGLIPDPGTAKRQGICCKFHHIAFFTEGSGSRDEAGDALGVFPAKSPDVVARVMESHRLDPDTVMLFLAGGEAPLGESLVIGHVGYGLAGKVAVTARR